MPLMRSKLMSQDCWFPQGVVSTRSVNQAAMAIAGEGDIMTLRPLITCPTYKSENKFISGLKNHKVFRI